MNARNLAILIMVALAIATGGCETTRRPVLYPDAHYKAAGEQVARQDVDDCMAQALNAGHPDNQTGKVAGKTAAGAAIGAASGGAWGLVSGDAGRRAASGAAAGAAAGLVTGALQSARPDPVFQNFVQKCLHDRGYTVIGWQ